MSVDYFELRALSRSDLKLIATNPALWDKQRQGLVERPAHSKSMAFGSALDKLLCDGKGPDPLPPNWMLIPDSVLAKNGARSGNAYKEYVEAFAGQDVVLLTQRDIDRLQAESEEQRRALEACVESILSHKEAAALVTHANRKSQVVYQWEHYPDEQDDGESVMLKAMPDLVIPGVCIVDLKTAAEVSPEWHLKAMRRYWYDCQASMQREGHIERTAERLPVIHVVVRNTEPFDCAVYELDMDIVVAGWRRMDYAINRYLDMMMSGVWQQPGHGQIVTLSKPRWWDYETDYLIDTTTNSEER